MNTMLDFFDDDEERLDAEFDKATDRWSWRVGVNDTDDDSFDMDEFLGEAGWDKLNW